MASFTWPSVTASNPSVGTNGVTAPVASTEIGGVDPGGLLVPVSVDTNGNINVNVINALIPGDYDDVKLTYVGATSSIATVEYYKSAVLVLTKTLTYDGGGRLVDVQNS